MSNQYPALTVTEEILPNLKHFIHKSAQLALQLDMIEMTGVDDEVTLTLLPSKILMIDIQTDHGSLIITTNLVENPNRYAHPFTLSTDDTKVIITGEHGNNVYQQGLVRVISDSIAALMSVFIQSRDNEIGKVPKRVFLGNPHPGYAPYPMESHYGAHPQQYPHPNQHQPQQPQAGYPMNYGPWGPQPHQSGPVGSHWGHAGNRPIKQGYARDNDSLLEGRNEKPGG